VLDTNLGDEDAPLSATITLSNLVEGTQYRIQFFAAATASRIQTISGSGDINTDTGSNGQFVTGTFTADATSQVLTVTGSIEFVVANALTIGTVSGGGPDITPPDWTATWPQVDPLSTTSLTVRAKTNETGTAYYVVLPDGAAPPSAAQVRALTDSGNTPVPSSGTLALTANTEATAPVAGLSPSTAYDVYFVAEDAVPNLQASPTMVDATTLAPDVTAPEWIATWPQAGQLSPTSITVRAQTNEAGTAYYVVLPDGATPPSATQVKALADSANTPVSTSGSLALTANTEATAPVTGLTANTSYDVYFIAEDAVPNLQATPVLVDVTLSNAGVVTWGSVQAITGASDIISTGVTGLAGADFGIAPGTTTVVNNGSVDIEFKSLRSGDSVELSNGITVAAESAWGNWGTNGAISSVGGTFEQVLDRNIGIETPSPTSATITLSGLTNGTQYQIQFFADSTGSNTQTISDGSGPMNSPSGQFVTGTFTANGTSQVLTVAWSVEFAVANALTIGVVSGGGNDFATWIGTFSGLNGLTGFNDDADFDGLDNGLENFLGTAPNAGNAGLTAGTLSGNTFTFTHPQNATPADDVSAPVYTWSTDLVTFHVSGESSGGITVDLAPDTDNPVAGTTTVTATVTGTVPPKLFVRFGVSQE
jgi:hypothetical protein